MQTRRALLGTLAGATLVSLAGCTLFEDEIEKAARQAVVREEALDETGYSHERTDEFVFEETIEVADESRDVRLTNYSTTYRKTPADSGDELDDVEKSFSSFVLFSTPTVSIAGRDVNPFDRLDEKELLNRLLDEADVEGVQDIEVVGEQTVEVLDRTVMVTEYEGRTEQEGVDVVLHLGTLTNDGDFIAFVGTYPDVLDETDAILTLAEGIDHPVDNE